MPVLAVAATFLQTRQAPKPDEVTMPEKRERGRPLTERQAQAAIQVAQHYPVAARPPTLAFA